VNHAGWKSIRFEGDHGFRSTIADDDYDAESNNHVRSIKAGCKSFYTY